MGYSQSQFKQCGWEKERRTKAKNEKIQEVFKWKVSPPPSRTFLKVFQDIGQG